MRALVYTAPNQVELQNLPEPHCGPGEVLVTVERAGLCGSDLSSFLGHSARRKPPLVLGHEMVGRTHQGRRVVANPLITCGHCARCLAGQQNLCASWRLLGMDRVQGTYAEFVAVPERQLLEVPGDLPHSRAVLTEPLAVLVHMFRVAAAPPFSSLAIVGAGTVGALALVLGKLLGFRKRLITDINEQRLSIMPELGADYAVNTGAPAGLEYVRVLSEAGYDVVVDAAGTVASRQLALQICRPGGRVIFVGMAVGPTEVDFIASIRKEQLLITSFGYTPQDFSGALDLLIAGDVDLSRWTETMPLERGQEAFERMTTNPGSTLKMTLSLS